MEYFTTSYELQSIIHLLFLLKNTIPGGDSAQHEGPLLITGL